MPVFDPVRRCHVWLDMPRPLNAGLAMTRELHFSAKVKPVHLPRQVPLTPGQPLQLTAVSAGQRPLSYQWFKDGAAIANDTRRSGADTAQLVTTPALPSDAGQYRVRIANALNQVITAEVQVRLEAAPLLLTLSSAPVAGQPGVTLTWSGVGVVLEQAPAPQGPWATVAGATSPLAPPLVGPAA